jgi:hypothetical protein
MKLTISTIALITFANAAAFAGNPVINGCQTKPAEGGGFFVAVEQGCITSADGSKGTGGQTFGSGNTVEAEAPAEK